MATIIHSNGSKWAGEKPDSLQDLENRLREYSLQTEMFGFKVKDYAWKHKGLFFLFGNFKKISAVFNIEMDDIKLWQKFQRLIRLNLLRD